MRRAQKVIVMQCEELSSHRLVEELRHAGWSVQVCAGVGHLLKLVDAHVPRALVLDGPLEVLCNLAGIVRVMAPDAALIMVLADGAADARIAGMQAGADACCSAPTDPREVVAVAQAICRRFPAVRRQAAPATPAWRLTGGGRVLVGPRDERVPLTLSESEFFARLLSAPGYRLPRPGLLAATQSGRARSMDVMVSRLRSKAQRLGVNLPLLAIRQWGYMFLADEVRH